jgi:hypothetical protein
MGQSSIAVTFGMKQTTTSITAENHMKALVLLQQKPKACTDDR